jgi:alginate O-acetyltransferase complex protein AlgI
MFRAASVGDAWVIYQGMVGQFGLEMTWPEAQQVTRESIAMTVIAVLVVMLEPRVAQVKPRDWRVSNRQGASVSALAIWSTPTVLLIGGAAVLKLAEQSFSPFLYFQF